MTNVSEIRRLPPVEAAKKFPVRLSAVVLYMNAPSRGDLFVAQNGIGIYVETKAILNSFSPGSLLEITGHTDSGNYAPIIVAQNITVLGKGIPPAPVSVSVPELNSGAYDSQWVQVSGIVRAARIDRSPYLNPQRLILDIATPGGRFTAWFIDFSDGDSERLTDSLVTVRGACLHYPNSRGQAINFRLVCNSVASDVTILKASENDPFSLSVTNVGQLLLFHPEGAPAHRVRIHGTVTYVDPGQMIAVTDGSGNAFVRVVQQTPVSVGDFVDIAGFVTMQELSPILEDAIYRVIGRGNIPEPTQTTAADALRGYVDGGLVRITAELQDTVSDDDGVTMLLRDGGLLFPARLSIRGFTSEALEIPAGTQVAVTGICSVRLGLKGRFVTGGRPESFSLFLRSNDDIKVLREPPWLTTRRLLWVLGAFALFCTLALTWALVLRRKNSALHEQIEARRMAEESLKQMHSELEERVEHRTRQLVEEVSARHEAEAVLDERNRLASELHDTLQQGLTGLALQIEAAIKANELSASATKRHLELARNIVRQSEAEVRRSVWNLRSQVLDEHYLAESIKITVAQALAGSALKFDFQCIGNARRFPEVIENNLLRLVQEAATNVLKHAQASALTIYLEQSAERIQLTVEDDGTGFDEASVGTPKDGHFGLLGMKERVKRLAGELHITGRIGKGCRIEATIPIMQSSPPKEPNLLI